MIKKSDFIITLLFILIYYFFVSSAVFAFSSWQAASHSPPLSSWNSHFNNTDVGKTYNTIKQL